MLRASLSDGSELPDWLSFDASELIFTGEMPADFDEVLEVVLTFIHLDQDTGNQTTFVDAVTITPAEAEKLVEGIGYESDLAVLDIADHAVYAELSNGRPLPYWLAFNSATMQLELSGIAPAADAELARIQICFEPSPEALSSDTHLYARDGFALEFLIDPQAGIDPAINELLANDAFFAAQGKFALDLATDQMLGALTQAGDDLPSWLTFDAESLTFAGTPPATYVGSVPVRIEVPAQGDKPAFSIVRNCQLIAFSPYRGDKARRLPSTANIFAS